MIANKIICACRNLPLGEGSSTHRNLNSIIHDANRLVNCAHDKVQTVSDLRLCVRNHKAVTRKGACLCPVRRSLVPRRFWFWVRDTLAAGVHARAGLVNTCSRKWCPCIFCTCRCCRSWWRKWSLTRWSDMESVCGFTVCAQVGLTSKQL